MPQTIDEFQAYLLVFIATLLCMLVFSFTRMRKSIKARLPKENKTAASIYTDYVSMNKDLLIRVFPATYESEATEGVAPNRILESGRMGQFMYYLISIN